MQISYLSERVNYFNEKYDSLLPKAKGFSSFLDIVNNLRQVLATTLDFMLYDNLQVFSDEQISSDINALETYFDLLERFPDFRVKELENVYNKELRKNSESITGYIRSVSRLLSKN